MSCQKCKSVKNVFVLKTTTQKICLQCIEEEQLGTPLYNNLVESLGQDFLNNPNIDEIPDCLYCAPRLRSGSLLRKLNTFKYYKNIRKYCNNCFPISRRSALILPHSILIHDSYSNTPLKHTLSCCS